MVIAVRTRCCPHHCCVGMGMGAGAFVVILLLLVVRVLAVDVIRVGVDQKQQGYERK